MFARTQRLLLRPGWPEDWQALFRALNDQQIVCSLARAPWPYTENVAREFAARPQDPLHPAFFLTLPGDSGSELIGSCGLGVHEGEVELGYWIARQHWGKGYATEAGRAVANMARTMGHKSLIAGHFDDNPASGRVLEKIGFVRTDASEMRYSAGRGAEARSQRYVLDLAGGNRGADPSHSRPLAA